MTRLEIRTCSKSLVRISSLVRDLADWKHIRSMSEPGLELACSDLACWSSSTEYVELLQKARSGCRSRSPLGWYYDSVLVDGFSATCHHVDEQFVISILLVE